jgi:sugar phosphate isomerase/epimerase
MHRVENMMSARLVGYDHAISIEHEDMLLSRDEGLRKAVDFLKPLLLREQASEAWWA